MLDQPDHWSELEASGDEMTDLLTALHLSVVMLDLKIRMMEAIEEDRFDLAMTYHLLILVRQDELDAHKWAMRRLVCQSKCSRPRLDRCLATMR